MLCSQVSEQYGRMDFVSIAFQSSQIDLPSYHVACLRKKFEFIYTDVDSSRYLFAHAAFCTNNCT